MTKKDNAEMPTTKTTPENKETTVNNEVVNIEDLQKKLNAELARLQEKTTLAKNRERFLSVKQQLNEVKEKIKIEQVFESENVTIVFKACTGERYNATELFSINNTCLLNKFIDVLSSEIECKITSLESKLMTT